MSPGPPQPAASGHWPALSRPAICSSYWIARPAGRGGGRSGRCHRFRWRRILSITGPSPIRLMTLRAPEQRGQTRGSASYTFLINRAHERLRPRANSVPLSELSWRSGCTPAAGARAETRNEAAIASSGRGAVPRSHRYSCSGLNDGSGSFCSISVDCRAGRGNTGKTSHLGRLFATGQEAQVCPDGGAQR